MNYTSVDLNETQLTELIPNRIWKDNIKYENQYFAAWDDDIHILFVLDKENGKDGHCIRYIYCDDKADERMVGNLLTFVEDTYRGAGETVLYVEVCGESKDIDKLIPYFIDYDYDVQSTDNKYLIYELAKLRESTFFEKTSQAKAILDKVFFYNQLDKAQLMDFSRRMENIEREKTYKLPDLVFGRYYLDGGEVKGFMDIAEVEENILELQDVYLEKDKNAKYAFPAMLTSALVISTIFLAEDTVVHMRLTDDNWYAGVKAAFSDATFEGVIMELSKEL